MGGKAIAEKLFEDLGPSLDPQALVHDVDALRWSVVIENRLRIDVAYDEPAERLVFAMDLGRLPGLCPEQALETLRRVRLVGPEVGSLHVALHRDDRAVLTHMRALPGLDVAALGALLRNLAILRRVWADLTTHSDLPDGDCRKRDNTIAFPGTRARSPSSRPEAPRSRNLRRSS